MTGIDAYQTTEREMAEAGGETARRKERKLLRQLTKAMKDALAEVDEERMTPELAEALYNNKLYWQQMALDVSSDENSLPNALKASILSLANFVEQRTALIMKKTFTPSDGVPGLVEINEQIIEGLSS